MVRKIKAKLVLRLRAEGLTGRQIAAQGMSRTSVAAVIDAADREGIGWDDVTELDEADVYARLFPGRGEHESVHAQPDWDKVHRELAKVGVTLKLAVPVTGRSDIFLATKMAIDLAPTVTVCVGRSGWNCQGMPG